MAALPHASGSIVQWLGCKIFTLEIGVRFSIELLSLVRLAVRMLGSHPGDMSSILIRETTPLATGCGHRYERRLSVFESPQGYHTGKLRRVDVAHNDGREASIASAGTNVDARWMRRVS